MITITDYFGKKIDHIEVTHEMVANATELLRKVNELLKYAALDGAYKSPIDPDTGTLVSGSKGGAGDGGFRLSDSATGASKSKHKNANAVDVYDPGNAFDAWLTDETLEEFGLYRETPTKTPGWCHLQDVPPGSGNRTYMI